MIEVQYDALIEMYTGLMGEIRCFSLVMANLQENSRSFQEKSSIASSSTKKFYERNFLPPLPWTEKEITQLGNFIHFLATKESSFHLKLYGQKNRDQFGAI